ncbi:unnamed protein product [Rhizoctonia solani]|uniref:Uncharacterized protein n=1 Tax=Rhizoctonia solani TaxID=456999 RepID=A0A8H3GM56_9AGAM|nr:unnamed protein product [Rhizoctonia solani]
MSQDTGQPNKTSKTQNRSNTTTSTRSQTYRGLSDSLTSINSKKSKNNDGSVSVVATESAPRPIRKIPSAALRHKSVYDNRVSDSQVFDECASTGAYVAEHGMGTRYDSTPSTNQSPGITTDNAPNLFDVHSDSSRSNTPTAQQSVQNTQEILIDELETLQTTTFDNTKSDLTRVVNQFEARGKNFRALAEILENVIEAFYLNIDEVGHHSESVSKAKDQACDVISNMLRKYASKFDECAPSFGNVSCGYESEIPGMGEVEMQDVIKATTWGSDPSVPPTTESNTNATQVLQALQAIQKGLEGLSKRIENIEQGRRFPALVQSIHAPKPTNTADSKPAKPKQAAQQAQMQQTQPETPEGGKGRITQPQNHDITRNKKTYAQTIKENSKPESKPTPSSKEQQIAKSTEAAAVRFVFRFLHGAPEETRRRLTPLEISRRLKGVFNERMGFHKCRVLEAKWNPKGNLVLIFPSHTNPSTIQRIEQDIRNALGLKSGSVFIRDVKWSKVFISGVPTGITELSDELVSKEEIREEIMKHSVMNGLTITQEPDWTIKPEDIKSEMASIAFAFEDPDGTKLSRVLREKFSLFGYHVRVRAWNNKPILRVCHNCLAYDHLTEHCHKSPRCAKCGYGHTTSQHNNKCSKCKNEVRKVGEECPHPLRCGICKSEHEWNSDACPERSKFRKPIAQMLRPNEQMDEE